MFNDYFFSFHYGCELLHSDALRRQIVLDPTKVEVTGGCKSPSVGPGN